MSLPFWIFAVFAILVLGVWTYRYVIRPNQEKRRILKRIYTPKIASAHHLFNQLYEGIDGKRISVAELKQLKIQDDAFVYGEIIFESFVLILQRVEPQAGEVFYDLGCGTGKALVVASLLFDFNKVIGVEILSGLHAVCKKQLIRLNHLTAKTPMFSDYQCNIKVINDDILKTDFSDGGVVFINATAFFGVLWEKMVTQLCQLKPGARVIVTSKDLPVSDFELIDDRRRLMSWGMATVRIYRRK